MHSTPFDDQTILTLAQRTRAAPWRLALQHARAQNMLIWVTRGSARAIIEGRSTALSSHNAVLIPAQTLFSFTSDGTCFGQTVALSPRPDLNWPDAPMVLRVREPKAQLDLTHYIDAMSSEAQSGAPMADSATAAYAQLMIVWAHRYVMQSQAGKAAPKPTASQRLMRAFCALIVQSEHGPLSGGSMAEFAARLGVTPTHLTRVCKAECGLTAADMLTQHTLQRARRSLERSTLNATQIAQQLGFSSPAYFTRFIRSHTGQTPSALRKAAKRVA